MSKKVKRHWHKLEWFSDGDKRLVCKDCDQYFVLVNGIPVKCQKP